ncbi:MAG: class I SAM-dependent methyltransferase [Nitrospirota bacterium]|nr:class I SAM-dependent methyltransferase [Nitrospirota bacterium]
MSRKTIGLPGPLYRYLLDNSLREPEGLQSLRAETATRPDARMQTAPEQGQFMAMLVRLTGAVNALEIGVYTGYSAACVALALPPEGRLTAIDADPETSATALRHWRELGVADKIDLHVGDATAELDRLLAAGAPDRFDFAFIDADKVNYPGYFERCLTLVRPGGLICIDNVLWSGRVADPAHDDPSTRAIRAFNKALHTDERVDISLVPIADGLTLARRK